jgi:hypothetical protein
MPLAYPLIVEDSLGVQSNQCGFTVPRATNLSIVVEASTDLSNFEMVSCGHETLSGGTFILATHIGQIIRAGFIESVRNDANGVLRRVSESGKPQLVWPPGKP